MSNEISDVKSAIVVFKNHVLEKYDKFYNKEEKKTSSVPLFNTESVKKKESALKRRSDYKQKKTASFNSKDVLSSSSSSSSSSSNSSNSDSTSSILHQHSISISVSSNQSFGSTIKTKKQ